MTPEGFRKLAPSFPETYEASHLEHPDFRVGKRIFATLGHPDGEWGMIKLTALQQSQFVAANRKIFALVRGGWGLRGATNVRLKHATVAALRAALFEAWRNTASTKLVAQHASQPRSLR